MDLSRAIYSRDLKIAAMRALDAGALTGEIARKYQLSPKLLERWRGEWRARGEAAFPGIGHRGGGLPAIDDARRIADLERKIGQLTMENDFLKKALQHFRDHHPPAVVIGGDACLKKLSMVGRQFQDDTPSTGNRLTTGLGSRATRGIPAPITLTERPCLPSRLAAW